MGAGWLRTGDSQGSTGDKARRNSLPDLVQQLCAWLLPSALADLAAPFWVSKYTKFTSWLVASRESSMQLPPSHLQMYPAAVSPNPGMGVMHLVSTAHSSRQHPSDGEQRLLHVRLAVTWPVASTLICAKKLPSLRGMQAQNFMFAASLTICDSMSFPAAAPALTASSCWRAVFPGQQHGCSKMDGSGPLKCPLSLSHP